MRNNNSMVVGLLVGLLLLGFLSSCSDDDNKADRGLTESPPPAVINQSLCTEMPGDEFDAPQVVQENEDVWRIRYPLFEHECGVYQLDTILNFAAVDAVQRSYFYEVNVCNRCESARSWNYLRELGNGHQVGEPDIELEIPQKPRMEKTAMLYDTAMPILKHRDASKDDVFRICGGTPYRATFGPNTPGFVSYSTISFLMIEPDEEIGLASRGVDLEAFKWFASKLLTWQPVEEAVDTTEIFWPILNPLDGNVTGTTAASAVEFCTRLPSPDLIRPYPGEYDASKKYSRQQSPNAILPPALIAKIQEIVDAESTD